MKLQLGYQGEKNARTVRLNVGWMKKKFPNGSAILFHQRPGSREAAPRTTAESFSEPDILTWVIGAWDTEVPGSGTAQIVMMDGDDVIAKSEVFETVILPSQEGAASEEAPDAIEEWITNLFKAESMASVAEKVADVNSAMERAQEAAEMARAAEKWANAAAVLNVLPYDEAPSISVRDDGTRKILAISLPRAKVYKPTVSSTGLLSWHVVDSGDAGAVADTSLVDALVEAGIRIDGSDLTVSKLYQEANSSIYLAYGKSGTARTFYENATPLFSVNGTNKGEVWTKTDFSSVVTKVNGQSGEVTLTVPDAGKSKYTEIQVTVPHDGSASSLADDAVWQAWSSTLTQAIDGVTESTVFEPKNPDGNAFPCRVNWETQNGRLLLSFVPKPVEDFIICGVLTEVEA